MSIFHDFWDQIFKDPILLLIAAIATAYAGALASKLNAWLGLNNEAVLRDVLHAAADNAIRYAATRSGLSLGNLPMAAPGGPLLTDAIAYLRNNNPETIARLGIGDQNITDILTAKIGTARQAG